MQFRPVLPEILRIFENSRWRLNRHLGSSSKVKADPEWIYSLIATTCKNLVEIGQAVPEILQILNSSICSLSFTIGKNPMFNAVVWVGVWFQANGTWLFPEPLCYLPGHIFRFFVSCTGPKEIVPVSTRGKRRNNNNNNNKSTMPPCESLQITNFVRPDVCKNTFMLT